VTARVKPGCEDALLKAINNGTLGEGSVAEGEYLRNMKEARLSDGQARWVEVCYCPTPLLEERPYWEQYFDLNRVQDAHDRKKCRDENGSEPWACGDCASGGGGNETWKVAASHFYRTSELQPVPKEPAEAGAVSSYAVVGCTRPPCR